jgi:hypothetical protein
VTITGSVACNRDGSFTNVSGQLTEKVTPRAVLQGSFFASVTCMAPTTSWTATTQATSGKFGAGPAQLQVSGFGCSGSSCDSDDKSQTVRLVPRTP